MNASAMSSPLHRAADSVASATSSPADVAAMIGRVLFAPLFLMAGPSHFAPATIGYAAHAGIPFASILVPASGLLALAGGLSVLLGFHTRVGALMLILFLVPVTVTMHRFWGLTDPMMAQMQFAMFMKNLGLLGGALILAALGPGRLSLDARRSQSDRAGGA